jgi:chemotaxis protein MotB
MLTTMPKSRLPVCAGLRVLMRAWFVALLPTLVFGCGHSEEEWQAQLDKYGQLAQRNQALQAEFDQTRARIDQLLSDLEAMGLKLDQAGTNQANLKQSLEETQRALDEFKRRAEALERIKARFELLRTKLRKMTDLGLEVTIRHNRMVISLPGDVLFKSGEDELAKKGKDILGQVAQVIASDESLSQRHYQVAGHTDNQPLRRTVDKYQDNWGLSVMRARRVLVYLVESEESGSAGRLEAKRWSAAGYGATDPVASNATPDGRRRNRRVELVLLPDIEEMLDLQSLLDDAPKPKK